MLVLGGERLFRCFGRFRGPSSGGVGDGGGPRGDGLDIAFEDLAKFFAVGTRGFVLAGGALSLLLDGIPVVYFL